MIPACCLFEFRGRVSPRRATHFLLLRQKKVSKEKATPLSATPSLRYGAACGARVSRGPQNSLRSNSCGPDPRNAALLGAARGEGTPSGHRYARPLVSFGPSLRSALGVAPSLLGERAGGRVSAFIQARRCSCAVDPHPNPLLKGRGSQSQSPSRAKQRPGPKPSEAMARSVSKPLWLRRGAERFADQGSPLFERSEFGRDPAKREHRRLPGAKRRDADSRVAFLLPTFLWRSKEK
ncbi:hypothetical protein SAMN03159363_2294 [Variovorax sp. EL159]|nr:hypothetical protein SAMN03159363_2294 [Variovorax sp. EL159]